MTQNKNKLIADVGMTLTNGDAFGKTVWLASGDDGALWYEVTDTKAAVLKQAKKAAEAADAQAAPSNAGATVNVD